MERLLEKCRLRASSIGKDGRRWLLRFLKDTLQKIIKRVLGPEKAVCWAFDITNPYPANVISNYCQGMVLLGDKKNGFVWVNFPERAVITQETAHISKRLHSYMNRNEFEIRINHDFEAVMRGCQRPEKTWINEPLIDIYMQLFGLGFAQSIEAYQEDQLVGGLWGLEVGNTFGVMSMFHRVERAGAISLGTLVKQLSEGKFEMIDCGVLNPNFARFGAQAISREEFMEKVVCGLHQPPLKRSTDQASS